MTDRPLIETVDYDDAMAAFIAEAVNASMCEMDEIYASLRRSVLPEGVRRIRVQVDGAENTSPEVYLSEVVELERGDVLAGNVERFHEAIMAIALAHLEQFMRPFFEHVGDAAESVGNTMDFSSREFGWDQILDAYERTEWSSDASGIVRPPQITAAPDVAKKVPPRTAEQKERFRLMWVRKQEEHDARRRRRRLR